ncbi:MAG TPA: hypothetical protein VF995_06055 [Actinomycetota bacterium]
MGANDKKGAERAGGALQGLGPKDDLGQLDLVSQGGTAGDVGGDNTVNNVNVDLIKTGDISAIPM